MRILIAYTHRLGYHLRMFDESWTSGTVAQKRLESMLSPVHAADRLTATRWFGHIEANAAAPFSNVEAQELPFQRWYRFKEAFSPRFVSTAIGSLDQRPRICVDPFGGSGTTALTCQFLGVEPATIEVNPFLADLIEAKLCRYDIASLIRGYAAVVDNTRRSCSTARSLLENAPASFVEPGIDGRWIFNRAVAQRLLVYRQVIGDMTEPSHQRLLRVLLGSFAVKLSNVVISGKGRRYRSGWETRRISAEEVDHAFRETTEKAIQDISRFGRRAEHGYMLVRGDARQLVSQMPPAEFSLFSPPYPNSFDYTDIYNVELWLLGYLTSSDDNRSLREATLRSHVQIKRSYACETVDSRLFRKTVKSLEERIDQLWDPYIPAMVRAYFADMAEILRGLAATMATRAQIMMVVGDSRYAGVRIDVASICAEMAPAIGFKVRAAHPIRAMRASAQQGGHHILSETLLHLQR
jgi:hypothetical protein